MCDNCWHNKVCRYINTYEGLKSKTPETSPELKFYFKHEIVCINHLERPASSGFIKP